MSGTNHDGVLLRIRDLSVRIGGKQVLKQVSMDLPAGQVTGLAGESGSGKSMTALAVRGRLPPAATATGAVELDGRDLLALPRRQLARVRGRQVAMVFQDPAAAFHPLLSIGSQPHRSRAPPPRACPAAEARARASELLGQVRLPDPDGASLASTRTSSAAGSSSASRSPRQSPACSRCCWPTS